MNDNRIILRIIWLADMLVNVAVIIVMFMLLLYGSFGIWDTQTVVESASPAQYKVYKPSTDMKTQFDELTKENDEVLGWLSVYGTNIDYPLVQGEDNQKYLTMDAQKHYSMSGAIFLDCNNSPSFEDFNTIIYGHHMAYNAMFGDISDFTEQKFFDTHRYGNLYYDGKDHGIEFFAFMEVEAYSSHVYTPGLLGQEEQREYVDQIFSEAIYSRNIEINPENRIVLLSTCVQGMTNGRHILAGVIRDQVYEDTFKDETGKKEVLRIDDMSSDELWNLVSLWMLIIIAIMVIVLILVFGSKSKYVQRKPANRDQKEKER